MNNKKRRSKEKKNIEEIKKNIKETFSDMESISITKLYEVHLIDMNTSAIFIISILKDSTWLDIKKDIEKRIELNKERNDLPECLVCYEKTAYVCYCKRCTFMCCNDCIFKSLKTNGGIYICPQ